ncbi:LysR family transcriptional regulator [Pseudomonas sp. MF6751]|uniref:LysR family transcriptional regulator n=1 Tax=Pseudomonas sp. MF6751 TaxID=2797528 RepID=UPI00190D96C1|nr:LysR family transcriptional regulator [Pseudomonas sp. MF6751]MBK3479229.1 LysR family transcriptional regulator [Pseudomonas sp. MF6751]
MPITPTLRQLEIFRTLGRTQNFSRAAEALHMSQPALSQAVSQMEIVIGTALFVRTKRSVSITPAGQRFLIRVDAILNELGEALTELSKDSDPRNGRVDVACLSSVATRLLPRAVSLFRKSFPGAVVRVRDEDPDGIISRVKSGAVDFAFSAMFEEDGGVVFEPVIQDVLHFVCRADHPLAQKEKVEWSDIASFDVVALAQGSGIRRLIDRQFPIGGVFSHSTYEVSRIPSILEILEQSDCVSVLPALAFAYPGASEKFHHRPMCDPVIIRDIGFILPNTPLSATAQAFKVTLTQSLEAQSQLPFRGVTFWKR